MTTKARKTGKRSLAVFLSILMLLTSWVFVAPTQANAATAGKYYVTVYWNVPNEEDTSLWHGSRDSYIRLELADGTHVDIDDFAASSGDHSKQLELSSIPKKITVNITCAGGAVITEAYVTKVTYSVNSNYSGATTLFEGKIGDKKGNAVVQTTRPYFDLSTNSGGDGGDTGSNSSHSCTTNNWNGSPTNTRIVASVNNATVSCSGGTATFSAKVVDQYGVQTSSDPTLTYSGVSNGATRSGNTVTFSGAAMTATTTVTMTASYGSLTSQSKTSKYTYHTFGAWSADTATCTAGGTHSRTCTVCSYTQTASTSALGHSWGTPTYTWSGYTSVTATRTCARNSSHKETETVNTTSSTTTAATCVAAGTTVYTATFSNSAFATQTKTRTSYPAALGHNMTAHPANAATCLAAGNSAYWSCSRCNKYFSDENGNTEITENSWVIAKKPHSYTGAIKNDGDGVNGTHSFKCVNGCNQYGGAVTHTWPTTGVITTPATCTTAGVRTFTCTKDGCGGKYTETIQALGHQMTTHPAKDATCLAAGNTLYFECTRCHKYFSDAAGTTAIEENSWVISAKPHSFTSATDIRDNDDGTHSYKCVNGCTNYGFNGTINDSESCESYYGGWVNNNDGTKSRTCSKCGHVQTVAITYTITFDKNGGTGTAPADITKTYGTNATIGSVTLTKDGYEFGGWSLGSDTYANGGTINKDYSTVDGGSVTATAIWNPAQVNYTVEHYVMDTSGNYPSEPTSTETKHGTTGQQTAAAALAAYNTGFTPTITQATILADGTAVATVYYARHTHKLTVSAGTGIASVTGSANTVYYGATAPVGATLADGYENITWASDVSGLTVPTGASGSITMPDSDVTLTATASPKTYTVTLNDNGGAGGSGSFRYVFKGAYTPASVVAPTREGYDFKGYFTAASGGTQYISDAGAYMNNMNNVAGTVTTLFAQWEAKPADYTVKHLQQDVTGNGYTEVVADRQTLSGKVDQNTAAVAKDYTGFTAQTVTQVLIAADGSTVVEIKYDRKTATLTLAKDAGVDALTVDGAAYTAPITYRYGATPTISATVKAGYEWANWTGSSTEAGQTTTLTIGLDNLSYTANTTAKTITVTLDKQSGSGGSDTITYTYNDASSYDPASVSAPTRAGYTFGGYYSAANGGGTQYVTDGGAISGLYNAYTDDATIYAKWTANPITLTLNNNGATTAGSGTITYTYGTEAYQIDGTAGTSITVPEKNGYTFNGYKLGSTTYVNASGAIVGAPYTNITEDSTLVADWTKNTYTATFKVDGTTTSTANFTFDDAVSFPANPTKAGHTFTGWTITSATAGGWTSGTTYPKGTASVESGKYADVTFEAQWDANTINLTLNDNNGTGGSGHVYYKYNTNAYYLNESLTGTAVTSVAIPTRTGYEFAGYYTAAEGGDQKIGADGSISAVYNTISENTVLYAHWTPVEVDYTVIHMQETVDGTGYVEKERETLQGYTEAQTAATAKTYEGFTAQTFSQLTIAGDGSTVVTINYNRNTYNVTLDDTDEGIESVTGAGSYKYGASVTVGATVKVSHDWANWTGTSTSANQSYTFTMPASDVSLKANTTIKTFTVKFYRFSSDTAPLKTETVNYGSDATAPADPANYYDSANHYTFIGWNKDYTNVTQNLDVVAVYASEAHHMSDWDIDTAATCETTGLRHKHCTDNCGYATDPESYGPLGHNYQFANEWDWTQKDLNGAAAKAKYVCQNDPNHVIWVDATVSENINKASCVADGLITYTASATYGTETTPHTNVQTVVIEKRNHNFNAWHTTVTPTCESTGTEQHECQNTTENRWYKACVDADGRVETNTLAKDPNNHNMTASTFTHTSALTPTCHTDGHIEYWHCTRCDGYYTNADGNEANKIATGLAGTVLVATPHVNHEDLKHFAAVQNDCTQDGNNEYWYCSACNTYYNGAEGAAAQVVDYQTDIFLPKTAHNYNGAYVYHSDDETHYRACTAGPCGTYGLGTTTGNTEACRYSETPGAIDWVDNGNGTRTKTCLDCGHQVTEENRYSIHFESNTAQFAPLGTGDSDTVPADISLRHDETTAIPTGSDPAIVGYTFSGWQCSKDNQIYNSGASLPQFTTTYDEVITMTAQWTAIPVTVTVIHETQNADGTYSEYQRSDPDFKLNSATVYTPEVLSALSNQYVLPTAQTVTVDRRGTTEVTYRYDRIKYTLTLNSDIGIDSVTGAGDYRWGQTVSIDAVTKVGYAWEGWDDDNGDALHRTQNYTFTMPESDVSFTATSSPKPFQVLYSGGDGDVVGQVAPQTFITNVTGTLRDNAYTKSYVVSFDYSDGSGNTADGGEMPTTLTANYTFTKWKFNNTLYDEGSNGGTLTYASDEDITMVAQWTGGEITLPTPTKNGWTFMGWYDTAEGRDTEEAFVGMGGAAFTPNANTTLYAAWHQNDYTVFYDNAATHGTPDVIKGGTRLVSIVTPLDPHTNHLIDDSTLYVKHGADTMTRDTDYTVEMTGNHMTVTIVIEPEWVNDTFNIYVPTEAHTEHTEWVQTETTHKEICSVCGEVLVAEANHTYNADDWTDNGDGRKYHDCTVCGYRAYDYVTYNIVFDGNENDGGTVPTSIPKTYGTDVSLPAAYPTKTGYDFLGWEYNGNNVIWNAASTLNVDYANTSDATVTLVAKWQPKDVNYTVKHYLENIEDDNYTLDKTYTLTAATGSSVTGALESYTGFTAPASTITETVAADGSTTIEYYYTRNTHTVALTAGTGIDSVSGSGTYKYGATVSIDAVVTSGFTWDNWSANGVSYSAKAYSFTMPDNDVAFTANAHKNKVTVTFLNYDGSTFDTQSIDYGTAPARPATDPTKPFNETYHYNFTAWDRDLTLPVTDDITIAPNFAEEAHYGGEATCVAAAVCEVCGTSYGDMAADNHDWADAASWSWTGNYDSATATATFTCARAEAHTVVKDATSGVTVTFTGSDPNCTEEGTRTYTAKVTFNGTEYTSTQTYTKAATGHAYALTGWSWNENHTVATATFTCANDTHHVETVLTADIAKTTVDSTCEEGGSTTYVATATFDLNGDGTIGDGETFVSPNEVVTIPATGHAYGDPVWSWTGFETATATFTCGNDSEHVQTVNASISDDATAPTCTEDGQTVYTATATFDKNGDGEIGEGETFTDEKIKTKADDPALAALGHDWGSWTATGTANEFTRVCGRVAAHTETATFVGDHLTGTVDNTGAAYFTGNITAEDGYNMTGRIVVSVGGTVLTNGTDYTYTFQDNEATLTITTDAYSGDIVVNAYASTNTYDYQGYQLTGGSVVVSGTYSVDSTVTLTRPTLTGYDFDKWVVTGTTGTTNWTIGEELVNETIPTGKFGNVTFTAQWIAHEYTVQYDLNGGENGPDPAQFTKTYEVDATISATEPTRTGYEFNGWKIGGQTYQAGDTLSTDYATENGAVVTLTADWGAQDYVIAYDGNGADAGVPGSTPKTYAVDTTLSTQKPTKTGYTFDYWLLGDAQYNPGATAGADFDTYYIDNASVTLTAHWTPITYTITFTSEGEAANLPSAVTKTYDTALTLDGTTPTRTGYTFKEWNIDDTAYAANGTINTDYATTQGAIVTATAVWTADEYTATFVYGNGSENTTDTYIITETIDFPANPTKTGYTFAGWLVTTAAGNWTEGNTRADNKVGKYGDVTFTAQWTANPLTVTFTDEGSTNGTTTYTQTFTVDEAQALTANRFERKYTVTYNYDGATAGNDTANAVVNYTFDKWLDANYTDGQSVTFTSDDAVTLTASWTPVSTVLPTPTKTGYTFAGWYDGDTKVGDGGADYTPAGNVTLTAHWTANEVVVTFEGNGNTNAQAAYTQTFVNGTEQALTENKFERAYTVTYDYDGATAGNEDASATATYTFDHWSNGAASYDDKQEVTFISDDPITLTAQWNSASVTLATPTKTGYTFGGWLDETNNVTYQGGDVVTLTADITLKAQWTAITYTITFTSEGEAANLPSAVTKTYDTALTLDGTTPTRTGYTFKEWNIDDTAYAANGTINTDYATTQGAIVTATAVWTADEYTAAFVYGNGSENTTDTYIITETIDFPANPTKTGYTFAGWLVTTAAGNWTEGNTQADNKVGKYGDVTFTAQWTANPLTVTFTDEGSTNGTTTYTQTFTVDEAQALTANRFERKYTVTYNYDGATAGNDTANAVVNYTFDKWLDANYTDGQSVTFTSDDAVTLTASWTPVSTVLPTPSKTGYTFAGWYDGDTKVGDGGADYTPAGNVTLTAHWTANEVVVTFEGNGNTNAQAAYTQTFVNGTEQALTENKFERAYTVTYDYDGATAGNEDASATATYTFDHWSNGAASYDDKQAVTFISDDPITLTAQWNSASVTLATPTKTGYTFGGWLDETNNVTYQGGDVVTLTADITLKAQWTAITYTATFIYDNGVTEFTTDDYIIGETITFPANPSKNGYDFAGWSVTTAGGNWALEETQANNDGTKYGNVTFTAQWTLHQFDYSGYQLVNGAVVISGKYDTEHTATLTEPSRVGYTFAGWKVTAVSETTNWHLGDVVTEIPTGMYGDVEFTAEWTAKSFYVVFNGNGNTDGRDPYRQKFISDEMQNLFGNLFEQHYVVTFNYDGADGGERPDSLTANSTFNGWKFADETLGTDLMEDVSSFTMATDEATIDLNAQWTKNAINLPVPTKTGYTFAGWFTEDGDAIDGTTYTPDADVTLIAHWENTPFTVTFDGNGATDGEMANQSIPSDSPTALTPNAFTRSYTLTYKYNDGTTADTTDTATYTFLGWSEHANVNVPDYEDKAVINTARNDALNLFAIWQAPVTALVNPSRDGYIFDGWYTDPQYDENSRLNDSTLTLTVDMTVYAKWTPIDYTATFVYDNGTTDSETKTFTVDMALTTAAKPTKAAYTFTGWRVTEAEGNWVVDTTYGEATAIEAGKYGNVVFTAKWTPTDYNYSNYILETDLDTGTKYDYGTYNFENGKTFTTPTREGYTFIGWKVVTLGDDNNWTDGDIINEIPTGRYGNILLIAQWSNNHFFVIFDGNDATDGTMQKQQFVSDEAQRLNKNLYERAYTVTFNYDGANGGERPDSLTANFIFAGWKFGETRTYADQEEATFLSVDDITLVAQWTPTSITLPAPTKTGYTFDGWFKDAALTQSAGTNGSIYWPNKDTVNELYAKWVPVTYHYTFDANEGTMADLSGDYTIEDAIELPTAADISRDGYTFSGWTVKTADGDENSWTVGASAANIPTGSYGDVEFIAVWTPITYHYTFDLSGGTMADLSGTYTILSDGIALPTAADISRAGYIFAGWVVKTASGSWTANTPVDHIAAGNWGDVTFKAVWSNDDYYVTYEGANITGTPTTAEGDTTLEGTITADAGYHMLDTITVVIGDETLERGTDYTYTLAADKLSAVLVINGNKVIDDIVVTAAAAAHDYTDHYVHNDGTDTHEAYCVCGQHITENCTGGTANCTTLAVCDHCGASYGELADHTIVTVNAKAKNCTTDGNKAYTYCSVCGLILTIEGADVSANNWHRGVDTAQYVLPKTGHNFNGTMRDNGNGTHSFLCLNGCGKYGDPVACVYDQEVISRDYLQSNAKCESPAMYYYSCVCGARSKTTFAVGEALGHVWEHKPGRTPTCTEAGHTDYDQCARCDKRSGFEPISALGHGEYLFDSTRSGKLVEGTFKYDYYKCTRCSDYYVLITVMALDQTGKPISGADVQVFYNGVLSKGTTDNNGEVKFPQHFKDGEFKITINYEKNRVLLTSTNVVKLSGGQITGTIPKIDTSSTYTTTEQSTGFRCSMCDFYEARHELPVYGWVITAIHYFVHTIQHLIYRMGH